MSARQWTGTLRPGVESATTSNKISEKQALEDVEREKKKGTTNDDIKRMIKEKIAAIKKRADKSIEEAEQKLNGIDVTPEKEEAFKDWLENVAFPVVEGLGTALENIADHLVSAAEAIIKYLVDAAKWVGNFVANRAREVANFFNRWFN